MVYITRYIKYFLLFFIILQSCQFDPTDNVIEEGVITYDIMYFETEDENPLISLLPTQMTISFKDDKSISEFEGWMGIFSSCLITDVEKGENQMLLKLSDKKYYYSSAIDEPFLGVGIDSFTVVKAPESKVIAGYNCNKGIVTFIDDSKPPFDIYYTNEINLKHPNINSPFKDIEGILMEFQMEINNIEMKLKFNNIKENKVSDTVFAIPKDYMEVNKDSIVEILKKVSFE